MAGAIYNFGGMKCVETPVPPPPPDAPCRDCDLYNPTARFNKCAKGYGDPHCVPSKRKDGLWVVFKKVVKE